jgi:hypothetical protein
LPKDNPEKRFPTWFKIKKYENTKNFGQKDWYRELSLRLYMQNALTFIKKQSNDLQTVEFKKTLLFGFRDLIRNPTDTSSYRERIHEYFQIILKHYRANNEWKPGSTLSLHKSTLSNNRVRVPEGFDTFLNKYEIYLPLQLKRPINLLTPHGLKTLGKIYDQRKFDWCSNMYKGLLKSDPNTDLGLIADVLSDQLESQSITSFIKNELKSNDTEGKSEQELLVAGIKTTDEIIVVDLLNDEDLLVHQFKETIRKLKVERQIQKKALKASDIKLDNLKKHQVLPYIDLMLWEQFSGSKINRKLMEMNLFPYGDYSIRNAASTMPKALSIPFLHSLITT